MGLVLDHGTKSRSVVRMIALMLVRQTPMEDPDFRFPTIVDDYRHSYKPRLTTSFLISKETPNDLFSVFLLCVFSHERKDLRSWNAIQSP